MRTVPGVLAALLLLMCAEAGAQVINGEGDYEGSSLHTPPPPTDADAAPKTDDRKKARAPEEGVATTPAR